MVKKEKKKKLSANAGDVRVVRDGKRCRFSSQAGKIPWRRVRQPSPVFLTGESHGQRRPTGP